MVRDWLADGVGLLTVAALGLLAAGFFAWFLAVTGQLLPHDLAWLAISEDALRAVADGRLVHFMEHDRAAFGGTLVAIAVLDLWLIRVPLAAGRAWAWWTLALAGAAGFLSFLTYLGTGYLDTWHGIATLVLLPIYALGLIVTRRTVVAPMSVRVLAVPGASPNRWTRSWLGRALLLLAGFGVAVAGLTIATIGSVVVFVPQDLEFIGLTRSQLDAIDPRLVPLIAHDRAGFGGGLAATGLTVLACVWCGRPSRSLWEALALAGFAGFGAAIAIHGLVGYLDLSHVGPAILGAAVFALGLALGARDLRALGSAMRLRALRMVDRDHAMMEFVTGDGQTRAFEITYEPVAGRPNEITYRVDEAFQPWMLLELQGWPGGIDHRTFTDMVFAFRSIANAEWASDDTIRELEARRRAELAGGDPGS